MARVRSKKEVVLAEDVLEFIEPWLAKEDMKLRRQLQCPEEADVRAFAAAQGMIAPDTRLAFEAGLVPRKLYGLLQRETTILDVNRADALLQAVDRHISDVTVYYLSDLQEVLKISKELTYLVARCRGVYHADRRYTCHLRRTLYRRGVIA